MRKDFITLKKVSEIIYVQQSFLGNQTSAQENFQYDLFEYYNILMF